MTSFCGHYTTDFVNTSWACRKKNNIVYLKHLSLHYYELLIVSFYFFSYLFCIIHTFQPTSGEIFLNLSQYLGYICISKDFSCLYAVLCIQIYECYLFLKNMTFITCDSSYFLFFPFHTWNLKLNLCNINVSSAIYFCDYLVLVCSSFCVQP